MKFTYDVPSALEDLFYITSAYPSGGESLDKVTVEQAAQALRNYLTYGDAKWGEVLNV